MVPRNSCGMPALISWEEQGNKESSQVPVKEAWPVFGRAGGTVEAALWNPVKDEASELFFGAGVKNYPASENRLKERKELWQVVDEVIAEQPVFRKFRPGWKVIRRTRADLGALDKDRGHDILYSAI